jgi:nucleotide-binding universal stress UspA family protein
MAQPGTVIVIGYDGSDGARDAVRAAPELLPHRNTLVVYVFRHLEALAAGMGIPVNLPPESVDALDQRAREIASEGAELARRAGLEAEPAAVAVQGRVADTILRVAREREAAAIVVGSRGLGGVSSALLGSVSSGLVHDADRPIVVIPHSSSQ